MLVIRWPYLGGGNLFVEFKSHSENLANIKKDCLRLKSILKKFASRIVSWEFLVMSENSYNSKWLLTSFFCMLRTMQLISFVYIASRDHKKIFC